MPPVHPRQARHDSAANGQPTSPDEVRALAGGGRSPIGRERLAPGRAEFLLRAVRRHAWVVALLLVLVVLASLGIGLARGEQHLARATLIVGQPGAAPAGDAASARAPTGERVVATSRELLSLPAVAERASRALADTSAAEVRDRVDVRFASDSDALGVEATADSPEAAVETANAYARAYVAFLGDIRPQSLRPATAGVVQLAEQAREADATPLAVYPLVGLGLGLVLALLAATMLARLDRHVRSVEELEDIYGLPVLAQIPRSRSLAQAGRGGRAEATSETVGFSEQAEAFRTLRTNLRYFNVDTPVRSILVASPLPGDGKSTVARYLAITMASMGDSVCLVNADLRKQEPGAVPTVDGLSLVLAGFELDGALTEVPVAFDPVSEESRVLVELPSGPLPPNPSELLESERMRWLIEQLEQRFDLVIVDSPALVTVSDALTLVPIVSGVLVVGGVGQTMRQAAEGLRRQIDLLGGRSLGVAANFSKATGRYYDYYFEDQRAAGGSGKGRRRGQA